MTLTREGWIEGRPYAKWPPRGVPEKFICLTCEAELPADPDAFAAHHCDNYRERPTPERVEATEAAIELARERGVTLAQLKGTGADGRILKSDVESEIGE